MSNHRFLLAVDSTPSSQRELKYVSEMIRGREDVELCLLYIYPEPPPNYYSQGGTLQDYTRECKKEAAEIFKQCVTLLSKVINFQQISTESVMAEGQPFSTVILAKQEEYKCDTVVLGKRGISKTEEFLFGSVSNAVARSSHDFAVWIVA